MIDCSASTDDALRYVSYLMFDRLHLLISNCNLYSEEVEWSELLRHVLEGIQLFQVFHNLSYSFVTVFKATQPSPLRPRVIELDNNGNAMNQQTQQDSFVVLAYSSRSIFHSDAMWRNVSTSAQAKTLKQSGSSGCFNGRGCCKKVNER